MCNQWKQSGPPLTETVLLIDDDAAVLRGLTRLLQAAGFRVESFSSPEEFLARDPARSPGSVLVLDLQMPGMNGLDLQRELERRQIVLPIIFMSGYGTVPECAQAMKFGAVDFLEKPFEDEDLLATVRTAMAQHRADADVRAEREEILARVRRLTPREHQVVRGVISGLLNKQIAARLGIAEKTIKIHRGRMMEKMQVQSVAELALLAQKIGLQPLEGPPRQ